MYKVKNRYAIRLKFGDKFLTSVNKLMLEAKISIFIYLFIDIVLSRYSEK